MLGNAMDYNITSLFKTEGRGSGCCVLCLLFNIITFMYTGQSLPFRNELRTPIYPA